MWMRNVLIFINYKYSMRIVLPLKIITARLFKMKRISHLKHCAPIDSIDEILASGYLLPSTQTDKYETEYTDKLFLQAVFHGAPSGSYYDVCFKLDKSILENRHDYYINSWFNYGKKDELTISLEQLVDRARSRLFQSD